MTWSNPGSKKLSALPFFRSVIPKLHTQRLLDGLVGRWMYAARTINDLESGIAPP